MKSTKTSLNKGKKPKTKFQEVPPTPHYDDAEDHHKDHMSSTRLRPGTPAPQKTGSTTRPKHPNTQQLPQLGQLPHPTGQQGHTHPSPHHAHNKHAAHHNEKETAEDYLAFITPRKVNMREISELWHALKTVDSKDKVGTGGHHPMTPPPPSTAVDHQGHSKSVRNLMPPTTLKADESVSQPGGFQKKDHKGHKNDFVEAVVVNGELFIPNDKRGRPEKNTFADVHDLGPREAERKWLFNLEDFFGDNFKFFVQDDTLTIEGAKPGTAESEIHEKVTETISLPPQINLEHLKVFRNKELSTLIVAYVPPAKP